MTATLNSSPSPGKMKSYGAYFLIYVIITDLSIVNRFRESSGTDLYFKK